MHCEYVYIESTPVESFLIYRKLTLAQKLIAKFQLSGSYLYDAHVMKTNGTSIYGLVCVHVYSELFPNWHRLAGAPSDFLAERLNSHGESF